MIKTITLLLLLVLLPLTAFAQETKPATKKDAATAVNTPAVVVPSETTAPYDVKMLRLAEVLGSIHYLRALCGAKEGSKWRDVMSKLLAAETPGPKRKARLIARFNRGYRAFDGSYANCTASALLASQRYVDEGVLLSAQITSRYGR